MKRPLLLLCSILLSVIGLTVSAASNTINHQLDVELTPEQGFIRATDTLKLPSPVTELEFLLHADLEVRTDGTGIRLHPLDVVEAGVPVKRYRVLFVKASNQLTLHYEGKIQQEVISISQGYAGGRESTAGVISDKGVFLGLSSFWYPAIDHFTVNFSLRVRLPDGWHSISQGVENEQGVWTESSPQDEIYLIAGRYHRFTQEVPEAEAQVYLNQPDSQLAERYLQATKEYLSLYHRLLGPYPYKKFALVENFWESGYGMPSFTLLGPTVIRLPFIITTSYPHEILHNWWGNGVFVDYRSGNWSEGLTAYLADHLFKERQGEGHNYRRDTLRSYADYVTEAEDFPLTAFRGNHGQISQAVGYGKTLMLFHMLRQNIGDETFINGLRNFYHDNLFKIAGFKQLQKAFEATSGKSLDQFFHQWITRTGAPALAMSDIEVNPSEKGFLLSGQLKQTQNAAPFQLQVPVYVQVEGHNRAIKRRVDISTRNSKFEFDLKRRPLRISIDPHFDLFRHLDPSEQPSSLGQLFGAKSITIILPSDAPRKLRRSYSQLAEHWAEGNGDIQVVTDADIEQLPKDRSVWLLGASNNFLPLFDEEIQNGHFKINDDQFPLNNFSGAITLRHPDNNLLTVGFLNLHDRDALESIARKLPHYGKYSYALFEAQQLSNIAKGHWSLSDSALSISLSDKNDLAPMSILTKAPLSALLEPKDESESEEEDDEEDCE